MLLQMKHLENLPINCKHTEHLKVSDKVVELKHIKKEVILKMLKIHLML